MSKVYVVVNNNMKFIDIRATKKEAEQLIKELEKDLKSINITEVTYSIKVKEL